MSESKMLEMEDRLRYKTVWTREAWSEDAVGFARRKLDKLGIKHTLGHLTEKVIGHDKVLVPALIPVEYGIPSAVLRAIVGEPEDTKVIEGNLLLNVGIQRLEDLTMIATLLTNQTATNTWSNANAQLGVGDSSTAEAASQTALQAATNKLFKGMNATYPSRSGQQVSFQSDFLTAEANYVWAEWCISQGAGTTLLNRKVAALGTKASGTWTLTVTLTLS